MKRLTRMTCATVGNEGLVIMEVEGEDPVVYSLGSADTAGDGQSNDMGDIQAVVDRILPGRPEATDGVTYAVGV